jgi:transcriptional regulator with AAA-type ATPase domain
MEGSPDISARASKPAPPSLTKRAFVGRAREIEILRSAVREAIAGRGQLIILSGELGIGKTRLAEEIANFATSSGARVF